MRAQASTDDASAGTPRTAPPRRRRWRKRLLWLPVWLLLFSVLQVLALRFVDPPFSAFMVARQLEAWGSGDWTFRVAYDWRDMQAISANLPVAMVAAEDQNFASHGGFDFKAIEKAQKHNE